MNLKAFAVGAVWLLIAKIIADNFLPDDLVFGAGVIAGSITVLIYDFLGDW